MVNQDDIPTPVPPRRHNTADTYQRLLDIEVKTLLGRLTELTGSVDKIFTEVSDIMLQMEDMLGRIETLGNSLAFQRSEVAELKKQYAQHSLLLASTLLRLQDLERSVVKES